MILSEKSATFRDHALSGEAAAGFHSTTHHAVGAPAGPSVGSRAPGPIPPATLRRILPPWVGNYAGITTRCTPDSCQPALNTKPRRVGPHPISVACLRSDDVLHSGARARSRYSTAGCERPKNLACPP